MNTFGKVRQRVLPGSKDQTETQRELDHRGLVRVAAAEGFVLLENRGNLLPLQAGRKLALYGGGAVMTVKGGIGSGDVNERSCVTIRQGLENAGFEITTAGWLDGYEEIYHKSREDWRDEILEASGGIDDMNAFFDAYTVRPFRVPAGRDITEEDIAASDTDLAIYVVSRIAGEGADRSPVKGDYYLNDIERKQIETICAAYPHVLLVINAGSQMDLTFKDKLPQIEAVLLYVQAGMEGGNALADVLKGSVTPSGKLTDTWAVNYDEYPVVRKEGAQTLTEAYPEGIYVGYRWFDAFGIKPRYSFGFGLSYTQFEIKAGVPEFDFDNQLVTLKASVANVGKQYNGREVVEVYAACPQNGMKKELKRLVGFAKTGILSPGESDDVIVRFPLNALASFDEGESAWVMDAGEYAILVGDSSDELSVAGVLTVDNRKTLEMISDACPIQEELQELVPPEAPAAAFAEWLKVEKEGKPAVAIEVRECKEIVDHTVPIPEDVLELANKLTDEELRHMVTGEITMGPGAGATLGSAGIGVPGSAGETSHILEEKYGIPSVAMADGPAGLRISRVYAVDKTTQLPIPLELFASFEGGFFYPQVKHENTEDYYQFCTAMPVGTLLAQSWDTSLLCGLGMMVAREMGEYGVSWWLAPGMNIHRDPLCGRNFEYYSEDPLISGMMAAAITAGVQSQPGTGTVIKHFACNNREDNRQQYNAVIHARALQEIYLRGFSIAVKLAQPMAIMTSYNVLNGVHTANSYDLCTKSARQAWGFAGMIMTDWGTTNPNGGSSPRKCIEAGNDLIMDGSLADQADIQSALDDGSLKREDLVKCAARVINLIRVSNRFENAEPYSMLLSGEE